MKDKEQAELLKESGEAMRNLDKEEEKAKDEETGLYLQENLYVLNDFLAEIGSLA